MAAGELAEGLDGVGDDQEREGVRVVARSGQGGAGGAGVAHQGGRAARRGDLADVGVAVGALTGDGHEQGARAGPAGVRDDVDDHPGDGAVVRACRGAGERGAGEGGDAGQGAGDHAGVTGPHAASAASRMTGASL